MEVHAFLLAKLHSAKLVFPDSYAQIPIDPLTREPIEMPSDQNDLIY
jgi:hypothetical protein